MTKPKKVEETITSEDVEKVSKAKEILDDADVPENDRMVYDPEDETDEIPRHKAGKKPDYIDEDKDFTDPNADPATQA